MNKEKKGGKEWIKEGGRKGMNKERRMGERNDEGK